MNFDGTNLTFNLPDCTAWGWVEWVKLAITINVMYGFVTHLVSIPTIRRYNRLVSAAFDQGKWDRCEGIRDRRAISDRNMIGLLLCRITVQLPVRLIRLALGLAEITLTFIANMRFANNDSFKAGCRWFSIEALLREDCVSSNDPAYALAFAARKKP